MKYTNWMRGWLTLAVVIIATLFAVPSAIANSGPTWSGPVPSSIAPPTPGGLDWGVGGLALAGIGRLKDLREQHTELVNKAKNMLDQNGDTWSKEKQTEYDGIMDQVETVSLQIDNYRKIAEQEREEAFKDVDDFKTNGNHQKTAIANAFDTFLRKSAKDYSAEELVAIRNTMSTTTGSQGGYTVQTEVSSQLIDTLKDYGGMRREASQITTAMGNDMSFPTTDGTAEIGEWVSQNTNSTSADASFGTVAVNCFKAGSKIITVPIELLQDSQIDIQALVFKRMADRIGRLANQGYSTGTGSGQPNGIVTASSVGKIGTTGQTATIIYDDLIDVIESLDYAYQQAGSRLCWMLSQSLRKVVRKIKDTSGRPIWTPSYDACIAGATADQLLGYDVCINNDMPAPGANNKSLGFGDFNKYLIRDALDVTIFRFDDSAYMGKGCVGFLAWARTGGNLLDTAAVKLYQHSAT